MSRQYDRLKCRQDAREAGSLPVTAEYRAAGGSLSSGSWNKCSPAILHTPIFVKTIFIIIDELMLTHHELASP